MDILPINIVERRKRDGFRAASAGYIMDSLSAIVPSGRSSPVDDMHDGLGVEIKLTALAERMHTPLSIVNDHTRFIKDAMRHIINPGATMTIEELRRHKGRIDLHSLLCNGIALNWSADLYEAVISHILPPFTDKIIYTEDIPLSEDHNNHILIDATRYGTRHIHYSVSPQDIPDENMQSFSKTRILSGSRALIIDAYMTNSQTHNDARTLAINVSNADTMFNDMIRIMKEADYVTDGYNHVVPYVIEPMNINDGTIVLHMFMQRDGSALAKWMKFCTISFERMLTSLMNTLNNHAEAYPAKGLGGQFPSDFFRTLNGYICKTNKEPIPKGIPDQVVLREILQSYFNCVKTGDMPRRMMKVFQTLLTGNKRRNLKNMHDFILHYMTFIDMFNIYDDFVKYNASVNGVQDVSRQRRVMDYLAEFEANGKEMFSTIRQRFEEVLMKVPLLKDSDDKIELLATQASKPIALVKQYLR